MTRIGDLNGLIPDEVGAALAMFADAVPVDQAIVEVGSYKGKSTCYLAMGGVAHVWAVDPWDLAGNVNGRFGFAEASTREAFDQQIKDMGFTRRITAVRGFSVDVAGSWDGPPIGLLYIDGDHSEDAVYADYLAWRPHLAEGATVVFDDLDTPRNPGVRAAIERLGLDFNVTAGRLAVCHV